MYAMKYIQLFKTFFFFLSVNEINSPPQKKNKSTRLDTPVHVFFCTVAAGISQRLKREREPVVWNKTSSAIASCRILFFLDQKYVISYFLSLMQDSLEYVPESIFQKVFFFVFTYVKTFKPCL